MVEYPARALDGVYAALSHPVRRDLVARLSRDPRGGVRVTELAAPYAMSLAAVSKHIRILEGSGLVRRSIVGRDHLLSLQERPLDDASDWIAQCRQFWNERLDRLGELLQEHNQ